MHPTLWRQYLQPMADEQMVSRHHAVAIAELARWCPPSRTLCVGCGDGTELAYFPGSVGVTLNTAGLQDRRGVVQADMHALPFRTGSFAGIFCKDTFEHALAPTIVLAEFSRVARDWCMLVVPDQGWAFSPHHTIIPTQDQMRVLLGKASWGHCRGGHVDVQQPDDGVTGPHNWRLDIYLAER